MSLRMARTHQRTHANRPRPCYFVQSNITPPQQHRATLACLQAEKYILLVLYHPHKLWPVLNGFAGYHMSEYERWKHESWKIKIETTNSEGESREQRYEIKIQRGWRKCWWGFREQQWTSASCGSPSRGSFEAGWLTALLSNSINALLLSGNKSCGCLSIQMQQDCTLAIHPNKTHIWQNLLYS